MQGAGLCLRHRRCLEDGVLTPPCVRAASRRHYYSWVLAMLISQHGELLHTFPRTIFAVKNFTVGGYSCMPDKVSLYRPVAVPVRLDACHRMDC